jgi:hypothetical protein
VEKVNKIKKTKTKRNFPFPFCGYARKIVKNLLIPLQLTVNVLLIYEPQKIINIFFLI